MQDIERFLYRYRDIKQQIKERELQVEELVAKKDSIADRLLRAPRLDKLRVNGGMLADPVCDAVQKMVDVYGQRIKKIADEIQDLYCQMDEITRAVDRAGLNEQEREYVRLRYFENLQIKEISDIINYSKRSCYAIQNSVYEKLTKKIL